MIDATTLQEEWLLALESGSYPQGRLLLCDTTDYCCLGVACEIAHRHGLVNRVVDMGRYNVRYDDETIFLPDAIRVAFKFHNKGGGAIRDRHPSLMAMNDESRWSFEKIAAYVREHRDAYFED